MESAGHRSFPCAVSSFDSGTRPNRQFFRHSKTLQFTMLGLSVLYPFCREGAALLRRHKGTMVLVLFGDTHELHREVEVPAGDILICVGDFTMFSKNLSAIEDFNDWLGELPHRHKIVVPGNHEFFLESNPERRSLLDNANVLID